METFNDSNPTTRKVTLSCRVLPEQKLLIAERANVMGMSLAQYVEAKVLQKDNLKLEKTIQNQQYEIERLKVEAAKLTTINAEKDELLTYVNSKLSSLDTKRTAKQSSKGSIIRLIFSNDEERDKFKNRVESLMKKYDIKGLRTALVMCVDYAFENDNAIFFLETVKSFAKKNFK